MFTYKVNTILTEMAIDVLSLFNQAGENIVIPTILLLAKHFYKPSNLLQELKIRVQSLLENSTRCLVPKHCGSYYTREKYRKAIILPLYTSS